jgi:hypothetical protein
MLNTRYTDAWHHAEDAQERAWLDAWMRGHINPTTLSPHEDPASAGTPVLAGSHR